MSESMSSTSSKRSRKPFKVLQSFGQRMRDASIGRAKKHSTPKNANTQNARSRDVSSEGSNHFVSNREGVLAVDSSESLDMPKTGPGRRPTLIRVDSEKSKQRWNRYLSRGHEFLAEEMNLARQSIVQSLNSSLLPSSLAETYTEYYFGLRIYPGQDLANIWIGWLTPQFSYSINNHLTSAFAQKVIFKERDSGATVNDQEFRSCYVVNALDLLAAVSGGSNVSKISGLLAGCIVNTATDITGQLRQGFCDLLVAMHLSCHYNARPLLKLFDTLLLVGLFTDEDIQRLFRILNPSVFDDQQSSNMVHRNGLLSLELDEEVQRHVCYVLSHLCDLLLQGRVETMISFAESFVGETQNDQLQRYMYIKQTDMPPAEAARRTKEFRCPPKEQIYAGDKPIDWVDKLALLVVPVPPDNGSGSTSLIPDGEANQAAMFEHLPFLLDNATMLLAKPSLRGSVPLDVAYYSFMDNSELALALKEDELEKVAFYLSRCGLQVTLVIISSCLNTERSVVPRLSFKANAAMVAKGYPDIGWDPVEGERYVDFLRFCVWVNGECVEENANLVIRLLIRRPECLGPALKGQGEGLLRAFKDAISLSTEIHNFNSGRNVRNRFMFDITNYPNPADENEDYIDMGAAILGFYSSLVDLLGKCAPDPLTIKSGKSESLRLRSILRSLTSMDDLEGILALRFLLPNVFASNEESTNGPMLYLILTSVCHQDTDRETVWKPVPVDVSHVQLSPGLQNLVLLFAQHFHDSWASRKLEKGWKYGETYSRVNLTHPRLRPFGMLKEFPSSFEWKPGTAKLADAEWTPICEN
ncbi:RIH domain protein [Trichuris suis]|nr:RIH domain protein [Trichuris suis]